MKCLCICHRGNSRSVALAYLLKDFLGHDAIAIGFHATNPETRAMLYNWADVIFPVVPEPIQEILELGYEDKLHFHHIPGDPYFRGFDQGLLNEYLDFLVRIGFTGERAEFEPGGFVKIKGAWEPPENAASSKG